MVSGARTVARLMLTAVLASLAWHGTARADDILDRQINFHIAASPLPGALIEFSSQSGVQVAAADAAVSNLKSNGVNGTYSVRAAMGMLLQGTGLAYSQAGTGTVAIAAAGPTFGTLARMGAPNGAGRPSLGTSAQASSSVIPDPQTALPEITVTAAGLPSDEQLAGNSLGQFVDHHATTHNFTDPVIGNLGRWRGGMQSICPATTGLSANYNAFVTSRLRAVAEYVGAPVQSDPKCLDNVTVVFTDNPEQAMKAIVSWAAKYFIRKNRFESIKRLIAYTNDHAIQGWYFTTRGGARALTTESALLPVNLLPVWPQIELRNSGGDTNGIGAAVLIVDVRRIEGTPIGAIADYLAVLALSVIQSPDHCDPLPSILDLMSSSCGAREKPTAITAGDLAFLKALYYKNTGLGPSMSRAAIQDNMTRQFQLR
ncbi:MAG TPA: STN domain-containing protein [Steroidobacteraceae bacterium]|nr:STN domain-containing protein [Steroidobacteraceae bacterium]